MTIKRKTILKQIALVLTAAAMLLALQAFSAFAEDETDLVITGGTPGESYTYQDGVLRISKSGTYTIGMADGVTSTSDRIVLDTADAGSVQTFDLTFDNLKLTNTNDNCLYIRNCENQKDKVNITLKGDSSFSTEQSSDKDLSPFTSNYMFANVKISGSGTLTLTAPVPESREDGGAFINADKLTLESGKLICKNDSIMGNSFTVNDGEVDISDGYWGIYCTEQFVMNGGKVSIDTIGCGVQVTGDGPNHREPEDGVVINDGDLDINVSGSNSILAYGISLGSAKDNTVIKNIKLSMPGTVSINVGHSGFGIAAHNNNANQTLNMSNGELEISVTNYAFTRMKIVLSGSYKHKNYVGDSASGRKEVPDTGTGPSGLINPSTGKANFFKYALITPSYPISYELDGGTLDSGAVNPENYTRVDSFTLNNPSKEGKEFVGWTGTGLSSPTQEVSVAEGSKGDRNYTAIYKDPTPTGVITNVVVNSPAYNGDTQNAVPETDQYTVENGSAKDAGTYTAVVTPKQGYVWEDGTTDPREVQFTVGKAKLTAVYAGETIEWYGSPQLKVDVTGFVGGESASTAEGYKAPSVSKPATEPHKSYKLTPSGGAAKNYEFSYRGGTLTVKCRDLLLLEINGKGRKVTLTWNKVSGATEYDIYGARCGKKRVYITTITDPDTLSYTDIGRGKLSCKYHVVAFRKAGGKRIKLAQSETAHLTVKNSKKGKVNASSVKVNKTSLTLRAGQSRKIKAKVVYKKGRKLFWRGHCKKLRYYTSDNHIATVDSKGRITGVRTGKCIIYALAPNGKRKAVSVTIP